MGLQPYAYTIANGTDSIVVMKDDGTGQTVVANQAGYFYSVQLSLDGKKGVVSAEDENGYLQIFVANMANLQNGNPLQLTTDATDHYVPQLSPDDNTVVFVKYDSAGIGRAYTVPAGGGTQTMISTPDTIDVWTPSYTPDGKKIVYEDDNLDCINMMNLDGTGMTTLTNAGGTEYFDEFPSVSPDGTKLVFSRYGKATPTTSEDVYIANIDGSNVTQLTNSGTAGEAWDPMFVNNKIVFVYYSFATSDNDIYNMNFDGSAAKDLTNNSQDEYFQY